MTSWVDQVVLARKEDAAEIARLRAENARLREAGSALLDKVCDLPRDFCLIAKSPLTIAAASALRAALKEGGGA